MDDLARALLQALPFSAVAIVDGKTWTHAITTTDPLESAQWPDACCSGAPARIDGRRAVARCIRTGDAHRGTLLVLPPSDQAEFAAVVSHELRTPLTSIKNAVDLYRKHEAMPDATRAKLVDILHRNTDRMAKMINDLLDLSKMEAGTLELKLRPVQLARVAAEAALALASQAQRRQVQIVVEATQLPALYADEGAIARVLQNLLGNAVKYTREASVVRVAFTREGGQQQVGVQDQGVGVSAEDRLRVFEKYARATRAAHGSSGGGTGLGLPIAKELVEAHQGRIWVESEPGVGATFCFSLPEPDEREVLDRSMQDRLAEATESRACLGIVVAELPGLCAATSASAEESIGRVLYRGRDYAMMRPARHTAVIFLQGADATGVARAGERLRLALGELFPDVCLRTCSLAPGTPLDAARARLEALGP
jgi:signal transduction histidine kinase